MNLMPKLAKFRRRHFWTSLHSFSCHHHYRSLPLCYHQLFYASLTHHHHHHHWSAFFHEKWKTKRNALKNGRWRSRFLPIVDAPFYNITQIRLSFLYGPRGRDATYRSSYDQILLSRTAHLERDVGQGGSRTFCVAHNIRSRIGLRRCIVTRVWWRRYGEFGCKCYSLGCTGKFHLGRWDLASPCKGWDWSCKRGFLGDRIPHGFDRQVFHRVRKAGVREEIILLDW